MTQHESTKAKILIVDDDLGKLMAIEAVGQSRDKTGEEKG